MGRRVVVLGTSGAGKSTVGAALAGLYGVEHVDLDRLAVGPDWRRVPAEEFRVRVAAILGRSGWVVDGDYQRALGDLVVARADTAVWLDLPLRISLWRMWRRARRQIREKVDLGHGNTLTWNPGLVAWVAHEIRSHLRRRVRMRRRLAAHEHLAVVHLRSQAEVDRWLLEESTAAGSG